MNASNPISAVPESNPDTPEDTTVTAKPKRKLNRKKLAQWFAAGAAVVGALAYFGSSMKKRGKDEFIEDVRTANADDTPDETPAS